MTFPGHARYSGISVSTIDRKHHLYKFRGFIHQVVIQYS